MMRLQHLIFLEIDLEGNIISGDGEINYTGLLYMEQFIKLEMICIVLCIHIQGLD